MTRYLENLTFASVIRSSTIDYPGEIAAVLFVGWCNMGCPYCHNKEMCLKPDEAKLNMGVVLEWLGTRRGALTGVVLSGGEPTILGQDVLSDIIDTIQRAGFHLKIDSNGTACAFQAKFTDRLPDYMAVDVKMPRRRYAEMFLDKGQDAGRLAADMLGGNLIWLDRHFSSPERTYELRTTVHRKLLSVDDLMEIKHDWVDRRKARPKWFLQQFGKADCYDNTLNDEPTYTDEELAEIAMGLGAYVRGVDPKLAADVAARQDAIRDMKKEQK